MSTLRTRWNGYAAHPELHVCSLPETTDPTVATIIEHMPAAGTLLDLGCGPGRLATRVADARPSVRVIGLDISPAMLTRAKFHDRVDYRLGDGIYAVGPVNGAWSVFLFQHLDPATVVSYLHSLARHITPNGPLLVQFIAGEHHVDLDHRYQPPVLAGLAQRAGLKRVSVFPADTATHPIDYPDWWWLTARSAT
jgi:cyclopropane fatty-acyl-phospholipid synthase-like methyltransferase